MYMPFEKIVSLDSKEEMPSQFPQASLNFGSNCLKIMFEEECFFPIPEREVVRIQQGVEMMVFYLLTILYEQTPFFDLVCSSPELKKILTLIKKPYRFHETFKRRNLLKVGSYYEKSKIIYPDEFDYTYLIADCDVDDYVTMKAVTFTMFDIFHKTLYEAIQQGLQFPIGHCLQFDGYVRQHGPAATLKFRYGGLNDSASCKSIFVDITPAIRVHIRNKLPKEITPPFPDWEEIIFETGSFLIIKHYNSGHPKNETKTKISITESEQHYLQNMSETHKCVLKLLKFIIKGHVPEEKIRQLIRHEANRPERKGLSSYSAKIGCDLSSYVLKTLMFHHCQQCKGDDEATVKDCVVDILSHLRSLFKESLHEKSGCSVLLSTMTGDIIEIADSSQCSLQIKKELNVALQVIDISELSSSQHRKKICIGNRLQDILQRYTEKRGEKKMKRKIPFSFIFWFTLYVLLFMSVFIFIIVVYSRANSETQHCFTGSEFTDGIVTADYGKLTPYKSTPKNVSVHLLCLDHTQSSKDKNANKYDHRIYTCGYEHYADTNYLVQKINDDLERSFFCDAYRLHEGDNHMENTSVVEFSDRIVSCVEGNITCRNEKRTERYYKTIVKKETSDCYEETSLQRYLADTKLLECYISDSSQSAEYNRRGICCCSSHPCTSPEQPPVKERRKTIFVTIFVMVFAVLPGFCCCGHFIISRRRYRLQKGIISTKLTP